MIDVCKPSNVIMGNDFMICTILSGGVVLVGFLLKEIVFNTTIEWFFQTYYKVIVVKIVC